MISNFLSSLALFLFLTACGKNHRSELTTEKYASLYAREQLIYAHFKDNPDSAQAYLTTLYREENVTEKEIQAFYRENKISPKKWADIQALVLKELGKLDPRKVQPPPTAMDRKGLK